jgi:predicted ATPase
VLVTADSNVGASVSELLPSSARASVSARALIMRGAPDAEAEFLLDQALRTARSQQARSLELRAATDLARIWLNQGKRAQARDVLSSIHDRFTEGFDTQDLKEASSLIVQLG